MAETKNNPRAIIENLIAAGDLAGLMNRAAEIHGHYCPGLALGVKAAYIAGKRLGLVHSDGMEEIMAVVECNNCFVDGIQAISGCTLGNNALIYKDFGKTAVTFYRRGDKTGLRIAANGSSKRKKQDDQQEEEARNLFDKAVKKREKLTPEESEQFKALWGEATYQVLERPEDEIFTIETVDVPQIEYAPIYNSINCSICGERVMETRIRMKNNAPVCIACGGDDYWMVAGRGIHPTK
jgi:formylmethanofuran dehydrogenase subunit E